ncbi:hypothetical protein XA68_10880 [Ophiocordyceps unilateralis]|uniref:Uncharacterized protein n=1 Tax=Ophiocordyceps unilateralis TaxID=268505 RepID=A0A2A9PHX5_OPHUN|nr:hypothetical protein XA68_10880 [Ophiocordyceps unilateralis]
MTPILCHPPKEKGREGADERRRRPDQATGVVIQGETGRGREDKSASARGARRGGLRNQSNDEEEDEEEEEKEASCGSVRPGNGGDSGDGRRAG